MMTRASVRRALPLSGCTEPVQRRPCGLGRGAPFGNMGEGGSGMGDGELLLEIWDEPIGGADCDTRVRRRWRSRRAACARRQTACPRPSAMCATN